MTPRILDKSPTSSTESDIKLAELLSNIAPLVRYPFTGERINCPVCGGKGRTIARLDRKWKPLTTDVCMTCGLFFTNPMPTEVELEEYYRTMYRSSYLLSFKSPPKSHVEKKQADSANRASIVSQLFDGKRSLRSLDFGCGLGELVLSLERKGFEAYGFEPGDVWSKHSSNPRITHANWRSVDYEDRSFDFISIIHVLEHLRSPLDCLMKIETLLKNDGLLWIEVPDMQVYTTKNHKRFHFAHVLGFSRDNLILAASECGFYPVQEIGKEQIGKRRSQISIIFRRMQPADKLEIDLAATVERNWREYREFSIVRQAISDVTAGARKSIALIRNRR